MDKEVKQVSGELPFKVVELREIVSEARRRYDLHGDEMTELVRGCIADLLADGALPVERGGEDGHEWIVQRQYGSRPDEMAENIVRAWMAGGVEDEHRAALGFALPQSGEVVDDDYDANNPKILLWAELYRKVVQILSAYGQENAIGGGDFWVFDNYWGHPQVKVYVTKLSLLERPLIARLRSLLSDFPGHEIVVAIAVPGGEHWPDMGLTIRAHEIVDGLQREYFPPEYRDIAFEGSRPGTEFD